MNNMKKWLILGVIGLLASMQVYAQEEYTEGFLDENGDTVYTSDIVQVLVIDKKHFASNKEKSDFNKLKRNVQIVWPYVKMAEEVYAEMQTDMAELDRRRQKKKYRKGRSKDLQEEFTDELKDLTTTQGKILVQLINRQTGNNCYELIKELKSPIAAFTWNLVAKRWDYDLKEPYNREAPENENLEYIIMLLEHEEITAVNK